MRVGLLTPVVGACIGCFVDLGGLATSSDTEGDGGVVDSARDVSGTDAPGVDGPGEAAATDATCDACALPVTVPSGWSLVGLDTTMTGTCPSGFVASEAALDPALGASFCSYSCAIAQPPSCSATTIAVSVGIFGCDMNNPSVAAGTGCGAISLTAGSPPVSEVAFTAAGATGASCSVTAMALAPVPANTLVCSNPSAAICAGTTCYPDLPPPFHVCIAPLGVSPPSCPAGFPARHVVSTTGTVLCTAPSCKVTATCSGTMELYTSNDCSGAAVAIPASSACTELDETFQSYSFAPVTGTPQCSLGTPPEPTLGGATMVCCQ